MAQWWERSPPTNVSRVRFPDPAAYVGWVCCWFSSLLREVFPWVLRFSPLLKNQQFQFDLDYCQRFCHEPLARVIAQALPVFDNKFAFAFFALLIQNHWHYVASKWTEMLWVKLIWLIPSSVASIQINAWRSWKIGLIGTFSNGY